MNQEKGLEVHHNMDIGYSAQRIIIVLRTWKKIIHLSDLKIFLFIVFACIIENRPKISSTSKVSTINLQKLIRVRYIPKPSFNIDWILFCRNWLNYIHINAYTIALNIAAKQLGPPTVRWYFLYHIYLNLSLCYLKRQKHMIWDAE